METLYDYLWTEGFGLCVARGRAVPARPRIAAFPCLRDVTVRNVSPDGRADKGVGAVDLAVAGHQARKRA